MRKVNRFSPLNEELCRWGPGGNKPAIGGGPTAAAQLKPQASLGLRDEQSLGMMFELDMPSPLTRPSLSAVPAAAGTPWQPTIETLQLLLGPASDAEAALHMHVKLATELASAGSGPPSAGGGGASRDASAPGTPRVQRSDSSDSLSSGAGGGANPTTHSAGSGGGGGGVAGPSGGGAPDIQALASFFQRLGYAPKVKTSVLKIAQRKGLTHQYLTVHLPDGTPEGGGTFIVDPTFKETFRLANPTPRYAEVLDSLDQHVAATKGCLRQAVVLLCGELAQCFTERGLPVPPWRTPAALLARWNLQGTVTA